MTAQFDHIVLGASDLEAGARWVEDMLGAAPQGGGAHPFMGTHNKTWRLANGYLEVIAIDPGGEKPARPRWFGLDSAETQSRLETGPRLLTWAVGVANIDAALDACPVDLGKPQEFERGPYRSWYSLTDDGMPVQDGQVPFLIEWKSEHPAKSMSPQGLSLTRLIAKRSETATLDAALKALGAESLITVEGGAMQPVLMAEIETEDGRVSFVS